MIRPDSLSVRIGRGISIPFQLAVNGQIAELSVDFGAGKGIASIREFHALHFTGSPADLVLHVNTTFVDFMLRPVVWAQAFFLDAIFPVGEVKPIFGGQHLADFLVAVAVVLIADALPVVVYAIENNVAMRMLPVNVPGDDVLCVSDAHPFHVFMDDFQHKRIIVL